MNIDRAVRNNRFVLKSFRFGSFSGLFVVDLRLVEVVELSMPTVLFNITNDVLKQNLL